MPNVFEYPDGSVYVYDTGELLPPLSEEDKPGPHLLGEPDPDEETGAAR